MTKHKKKHAANAPKKMGRPATGKDPNRCLRVNDDDWASWQDAAEVSDLSLSEWLRGLANRAASRVLR